MVDAELAQLAVDPPVPPQRVLPAPGGWRARAMLRTVGGWPGRRRCSCRTSWRSVCGARPAASRGSPGRSRPTPPRDEPGQRGEPGPVGRLVPYPAGVSAQHRVLVPEIGWDRGRGFDVASVRFPRSPRRTRRATLIAPGAPRVLPCRQSLGAAGGSGVHGVGMLPPR